jgi:hypothetical protein
MKYTTVEDIDDMETEALINSPRSLEACMREGITPNDLLHIPESHFNMSTFPKSLKHIHYEFYEAKRKELLYNVRKIRKELITKQHNSSIETCSSTPNLPHFLSLANKRERVKSVQAKFIKDRCFREELVKKDLLFKEVERNYRIEKIADFNEDLAKNVKNRIEKEFSLQRERKRKEEIEEDMIIERKNEYFEKDFNEKQRVQTIIEKRINEIRVKKKANEEKAKDYYEKMVARNDEIILLRKENLEEKDLEEKKRIELLLIKKIEKQKEMEKLWDRKILKTRKVKEDIKKYFEERQDTYYEMKKIFDTNFQERLKKMDGRPKSLESIQGNIPQVSQTIINENIYQRELLDEKLEQDKEKVEKAKQFNIRKQNYQKHLRSLKLLKKNWNQKRIKNKEDYSKTLSTLKFLETSQKLSELEQKKTQDQEKSLKIIISDEMTKYKLKAEVEKMSIFKNWSEPKLLKIINFE